MSSCDFYKLQIPGKDFAQTGVRRGVEFAGGVERGSGGKKTHGYNMRWKEAGRALAPL
jgi:hypothetical protein